MSSSTLATLFRWSRRGAWAALLATLVLPLAAFLADLGLGREVLLIVPHDPSMVSLNRSLWIDGEPVAEIYGSPMSEPTRVILFRDQTVVQPEEDPSLVLLAVDAAGKRPLQTKTLWWAVRLAEAGLGAITLALLGLTLFVRRRERLSANSAIA